MIIYCSECDKYLTADKEQGCDCGEWMIELSEEDVINLINNLQAEIKERV